MKFWVCNVSLFCILCMALPLSGQHQLSGRVVDAGSREPLAGVDLFLPDLERSVTTGTRGRFSLSSIPAGEHRLVVFYLGYRTAEQSIMMPERDLEVELPLSSLELNLNEVVILAEREKQFALSRLRAVEGTAIYSGKKTEVVLPELLTFNAAANTARQLYSQVVGLNIYEANDAGLQLNLGGRGLDPNRSANFNTRQNGYDISADVLGYPESYYSPPAEALGQIQVVRGAASLQYGTQFGGLINFVFKKPVADKKLSVISRQTIGSNALFTSFNSLSGTVGKFSYYTYYNRKQGEDFRPNSDFSADNFYGHIGYAFSEKTQLTAEFTYLKYLAQQPGGLTDAQFYEDPDFSNRTRNWFAVDWKLFALKLDHKFSPRTDLSVQLFGLDATREAVGFRTNRVSQVDDLTAPRDLLIGVFQNVGLETRLLHRYRIAQKEAVGLLGIKLYRSDNSAIQGPGSATEGADFSLSTTTFPAYPDQSNFRFPNFNAALFGEQILYLTDQLSITPGFRLEHIRTESKGTFRRIDFDLAGNPIRDELFEDNRVFERQLFLLGIGLSYKPKEGVELYGNISQNYRSVTFNDIRIVNPSFQVDPDIGDESGFTADFGVRGRTDRFSYDVGGFSLLYNDRLGEVLRAETRINASGNEVETGRVIRFRGNIGTALIYGLEGLVDWIIVRPDPEDEQATKLNAFVNLALTQSTYLDSEITGVAEKQVEFIPAFNLKTGLRFGYNNLLGSIQYAYLSRQFTDATNAPQDVNDNQSGIVGSIPAYGVMDVSLSYQWRSLRFESGVNNLLNERYFTRRATGYPGPGILPAAPRTVYLTVGVSL